MKTKTIRPDGDRRNSLNKRDSLKFEGGTYGGLMREIAGKQGSSKNPRAIHVKPKRPVIKEEPPGKSQRRSHGVPMVKIFDKTMQKKSSLSSSSSDVEMFEPEQSDEHSYKIRFNSNAISFDNENKQKDNRDFNQMQGTSFTMTHISEEEGFRKTALRCITCRQRKHAKSVMEKQSSLWDVSYPSSILRKFVASFAIRQKFGLNLYIWACLHTMMFFLGGVAYVVVFVINRHSWIAVYSTLQALVLFLISIGGFLSIRTQSPTGTKLMFVGQYITVVSRVLILFADAFRWMSDGVAATKEEALFGQDWISIMILRIVHPIVLLLWAMFISFPLTWSYTKVIQYGGTGKEYRHAVDVKSIMHEKGEKERKKMRRGKRNEKRLIRAHQNIEQGMTREELEQTVAYSFLAKSRAKNASIIHDAYPS